MARIELRNLKKVYTISKKVELEAVKSINLEIEDKEFVVFVGPSGCGKSTTLRMIAGLEDVTSGEIIIEEKVVNEIEPKLRDIAMVFQNYALYPHMTVYENMAFGLKNRKVPKDIIEIKVREVAKTLGIEDELSRRPKELSGGQRQRVAMGRAMVRNPKVFLMDEPLSNLDAKLRVQMRNELTKLHRDLQTTFVFVTHDQIEAMTLATKIVVMNDGNIMQVDTPERIFNNPANLFVAGFIGSPQMNFLNGKYIVENGAFYFVRKDLKILIQNIDFNCDIKSGREVILGIRPEYIQISNNNQSSAIHCTVSIIENMGSYQNIYCAFDEENIVIKVDASTKVALGDKINVELVKDKIQLFDKVSELSLYYEKR